MLIIAVAHGYGGCDPFTTSTITREDRAAPEPIDPNDPDACLEYICQKKELQPEWVDEILVVLLPEYDADPEVIHHYTEFGDDDDS